ncbi:MAG: 5-formyltetrahydrofolate cyclo-ligase [Xanthobacteraceae bacterium]
MFLSSADVTKAEIRRTALARRDGLPAQERADAAQAVASRPFPLAVAPGAIVAGYSPMRSEISPWPLLRRLADEGARLALPVVIGRGQALVFRAFALGDALGSGVWGIREPLAGSPEVAPDILIVPLAAFDRTGQRIGYGAGYYDLTLARLRAEKTVVAAGLAFQAQEIAAVPSTRRDERLDLVLTEHGVIDCRGA